MRKEKHSRKTNETDISVQMNVDGSGVSEIDTGIDFFNHMLDQLAKHSLIDLKIKAEGDVMTRSVMHNGKEAIKVWRIR